MAIIRIATKGNCYVAFKKRTEDSPRRSEMMLLPKNSIHYFECNENQFVICDPWRNLLGMDFVQPPQF